MPAPARKGSYLSDFICSPGRACVRSVREKEGWAGHVAASLSGEHSLTESVKLRQSLILAITWLGLGVVPMDFARRMSGE